MHYEGLENQETSWLKDTYSRAHLPTHCVELVAAASRRPLSSACTGLEESGISETTAARLLHGAAIRFLGSVYTRPLGDLQHLLQHVRLRFARDH